MRQTLKTFAIAFGSAVAMAIAIELVQRYSEKITSRSDDLLDAGGRLWARAMDDLNNEAEVRRSLPWVLWYAWEAQHDAISEEQS